MIRASCHLTVVTYLCDPPVFIRGMCKYDAGLDMKEYGHGGIFHVLDAELSTFCVLFLLVKRIALLILIEVDIVLRTRHLCN
jgi:hypothetical protein